MKPVTKTDTLSNAPIVHPATDTAAPGLYNGNIYFPAHVTPISPNDPANHNVRTVMPIRVGHAIPECDDITEVVKHVYSVVLTDSNSTNEKTRIYPNPIQKKFHVYIENLIEESIIMQMADASGKTFELGTYQLIPGTNDIEADISNLSLEDGIYFLKIITGANTRLIKLVIQQ